MNFVTEAKNLLAVIRLNLKESSLCALPNVYIVTRNVSVYDPSISIKRMKFTILQDVTCVVPQIDTDVSEKSDT
jgi:hypothetical protein